jgi:hypothetical protein
LAESAPLLPGDVTKSRELAGASEKRLDDCPVSAFIVADYGSTVNAGIVRREPAHQVKAGSRLKYRRSRITQWTATQPHQAGVK